MSPRRYLRPDDAPPVSKSATWALWLALGSFVCLGPPGAVVAIVLGVVGLREVASSGGRLTGRGQAIAGVVVGGFHIVAVAGAIVLAFVGAFVGHRGSRPVVVSPPPAATAPRGAPAISDEGKTTRLSAVREVKIGHVTLVDIPPTKRSLAVELEREREKAQKAKETLVLLTVGDALSADYAPCRPCMSVTAILGDPRMQAALGPARLVRVDTYELRSEIEELGAWTQWTPGFFLLGPDLSARDGIDGGEWDDDTPENVAPVLSAFMKGKLPHEKRRQPTKRVGPKKSPGRSPRTAPTVL